MHEIQTIVTNVRGVCPFVSLSVMLLTHVWCIRATFAKVLWHLINCDN